MVGKLWDSVEEKTDQVVNIAHANQRERGRQETYYGFSREITGPHVVRILRVPQEAAHTEHQTCQSNSSPLLALVIRGGPMMSAATRSMGAPAWYLYRHLPPSDWTSFDIANTHLHHVACWPSTTAAAACSGSSLFPPAHPNASREEQSRPQRERKRPTYLKNYIAFDCVKLSF